MEQLFIIELKKKNCRTIKKMIFFYVTQVVNINMVLLMLLEPSVLQSLKPSIKNIFTKVLKGHIAVANTDLKLR
jgi:Xaa-Pro aminopeptidase